MKKKMDSLEGIADLLERIEKNQQIAMKQEMLNSAIKLWSCYGKELHEIKESEVTDVASKRHEEAAVFMIRQLLFGYDMRLAFSGEDWTLFKLNAEFWMSRPAMKTLWGNCDTWFSMAHRKFIDALIK